MREPGGVVPFWELELPFPFWIFRRAAREESRPPPPMHFIMWLFIRFIGRKVLQLWHLAWGKEMGFGGPSPGGGEGLGESWEPEGVLSLADWRSGLTMSFFFLPRPGPSI